MRTHFNLPRLDSAIYFHKFKQVFIVLVIFSFLTNHCLAQRTCGAEEKLEWELKENPYFKSRHSETEQFIRINQSHSSNVGGIITIPVVVHVVYKTDEQNISDKQIFSQIDILNKDFRRLNANRDTLWPQAADIEIEFCLATINPEGNPTSGITRTYTDALNFRYASMDQVMFSRYDGKDAWPADQYLNIWVCNLTNNILGYANFPGTSPERDGIVCGYKYFGDIGTVEEPFHLGRTATHEVGHWLGLFHIWGSGGCSNDDLVVDTPLAQFENRGCDIDHISCESLDMVQNYMDYSDDPCMNLFTEGQKSRMRALFEEGGWRESLLSSQGCAAVIPSCDDGFRNGVETGIDCGGPDCMPCCKLEIVNVDLKNTSCGLNNGFVKIITNETELPIEFSLDSLNYFSDSLFTNLMAGSYTAYVRDQNNCTSTFDFEIGNSQVLNVEPLIISPACNESNGSIELIISNAENPMISVNQSPFQNIHLLENLGAENYLIVVKDANNCVWKKNIALGNINAVQTQLTLTHTDCLNPLGRAEVLHSGTNNPYSYSINNGPFQDSKIFTELSPEEHVVIIQDGSGCKQVEIFNINYLITMQAQAQVTNTSCGLSNGSINIIAENGEAPYSYSLNNGIFQEDQFFNNLDNNQYKISIKDSLNCLFNLDSIIIEESEALEVEIHVQDVQCAGDNNGIIELKVLNGTAPYEYSSSFRRDGDGIIKELESRNHYIIVEDANGCRFRDTVFVGNQDTLDVSIVFENNQLVAQVSGGVEPYQYSWRFGSENSYVENPIDTTYWVWVTDANGCFSRGIIRNFITSTNHVFQEGLIKVMPNPANEFIQIQWDNDLENILFMELININGQETVSLEGPFTNNMQLDINKLSPGAYFLKVITAKHAGVVRFIKL